MSLLISEKELIERTERAKIVYRKLGQGSSDESRPRSETFKSGIPSFVREVISAEAKAELGTHKEIGKSWGVSDTTVKNIEDGRVGRHELRGVDRELLAKRNEMVELIENKIVDKTNEKLLATIESMDDAKIKDEKPIAQSVIARNLASILDRLSPKVGPNLNVQFNVFQPREKNINEFGEPIRVIESREKH